MPKVTFHRNGRANYRTCQAKLFRLDWRGMTGAALPLPLLIWLSPQFPVGAFAYSQGLEWAVESGQVANAASLEAWLAGLVTHGAIRADTVLLACAHRAAASEAWDGVSGINELALALAPSRERLLETSAQGNAFLAAVRPSWPSPALAHFAARLGEADCAYPVAVAVAAAAHGIADHALCAAFALATLSNLVSAAVRLGPIGQTEAQAIIASLCPAISALATFAAQADPSDCGTAAWGADIASMRHETQYSRLFRS